MALPHWPLALALTLISVYWRCLALICPFILYGFLQHQHSMKIDMPLVCVTGSLLLLLLYPVQYADWGSTSTFYCPCAKEGKNSIIRHWPSIIIIASFRAVNTRFFHIGLQFEKNKIKKTNDEHVQVDRCGCCCCCSKLVCNFQCAAASSSCK